MDKYSIHIDTEDRFCDLPINKDNFRFRSWQKEAHELFRGRNNILLISPSGSGKSAWALHEVFKRIEESNFNQKALFAIPQQTIAGSFRKNITIEGIECFIENDFIHENGNFRSSIKETIQFLKTSPKNLHKGNNDSSILTALCTHQALALLYKNQFFKTEEAKRMFDNLILVVDEAHHLTKINGTEKEKFELNRLSRLINFALANGKNLTFICLTATPFRGDEIPFIDEEFRSNFDPVYHRSMNEHLKEVGIQRIDFQYRTFLSNPLDILLKEIKNEPKERHLIIFPKRNQGWRGNDEVDIKFLKENLEKNKYNVCDLVSRSTKDTNKRNLINNPEQFDVVITVNIVREGVDWEPCSRIHHLTPGNSNRLEIQTFGRAIRQYDGKINIKETFYYPSFSLDKIISSGEEKVRQLFEDSKNQLLLQMMLDEAINPIKITIKNPNNKNDYEKNVSSKKETDLSNAFKSNEEYKKAKSQLIDEYLLLEDKSEEKIKQICYNICKKFSIQEENIEAVSEGLFVRLLRHITKKQLKTTLSISFLRENGFDYMVKLGGGLKNSILFGAEHKPEDLEKILKIYKKFILNNDINKLIIFNQKYGLNNLSEKDIRISFPNANSDPELSNWHSGISKRYKKNDLDFAFAEKCKELQIDLEIHFNASGHRRKEFEFRRWAFFFKEFKEKNNGKPPSQIAKDSFEKTLATLKQYYHKSYKKNDDV